MNGKDAIKEIFLLGIWFGYWTFISEIIYAYVPKFWVRNAIFFTTGTVSFIVSIFLIGS